MARHPMARLRRCAVGGTSGRRLASDGAEVTPARLELERSIEVAPGQIVLVTYDPDTRAMIVQDARATH